MRGSYRGDNYYVYNKDILGSTSSITKEDGSAAAVYDYSDFGQIVFSYELIDNEICYTGSIHDESTGLHYMNARYYNPENGRFISQDTYRAKADDPSLWHLYVYCANNPINYIDPSGHDFIYLNSTKGACGAGHAAILIKYSGKWKYYSWEGKGYKGSHAKLKNVSQGINGRIVEYKINKDKNVNRPKNKSYDQYIYIVASSIESYKYAKEIRDGKHYKNYHLTAYNCAWVAIDILKRGGIGQSTKNKLDDLQYGYTRKNGKKYKTIKTIIPNFVVYDVAKIFGQNVRRIT